jgi:hypothetical protein
MDKISASRKIKSPRPVSEKQKAGAVEELKKNSHFLSKPV